MSYRLHHAPEFRHFDLQLGTPIAGEVRVREYVRIHRVGEENVLQRKVDGFDWLVYYIPVGHCQYRGDWWTRWEGGGNIPPAWGFQGLQEV